MTRRTLSGSEWWQGILGITVLLAGVANAQDGYRIEGNHIVIDRAAHWQEWQRPVHATEIDADAVRPRNVRRQTDAIADIDQFTILIGDAKALQKLGKDIKRESGTMPLNIRTQPAMVAGVPILYQKDNSKTGVKAGDPIAWFYYYGGIREVPRNVESANNILDGDPTTYWEPTTEVSSTAWFDLPESRRGPIVYYVTEGGQERRSNETEYNSTGSNRRRVAYHSHSLAESYIDIELGRVVPVRSIVLHFVDPEVGEPFRQFRILGTASHFRDAPLELIARTNTPNVDEQVVTFELDGNGPGQAVGSGHPSETVAEFEATGAYRQLHRLRIALTDSRFDKFRPVTAEEYAALPVDDQGSIEYHIVNAVGTETKVTQAIYERVGDERKGQLVYYQRERPRLAGVEVVTQGDNIALGVIDGGGSVDLTGTFGGDPGFDGLYESNYLQLVWSPDARFSDRGIMTLDLGAQFWPDFYRMVGFFSGVDEVVTWTSDGERDPNGNLRFTEIDRNPSGQGRGNIEIAVDEASPVRYIRTQIFSDAAGRAGGYNTGNKVRELQIFGRGFPSEVTLTSPVIELDGAVFLGGIEWDADIPDADKVDLEIRTRTGDRLVEVTEYFGSGGEVKTETEYGKLPTSFRGPTVTRRVPGGGWSTWSQRYQVSGQRVSSPSPRRYVQIQARMLSSSPELAAVLRSVRLETLSPAAVRSFAEVWPAEVELGIPSDFEVFVRPTFVERDPGNQASSRFDEVLLDPAPIQNLELLGVALGSETALADGSAQQFTSLAMRTDPASGAPTSWFEAPDGDLYQALVDPVSGDSLKILQGRVAAGSEPQQSAPLLLRLPRKVASLPVGIDTRGYHRRIVEEGDEVPVDDDGRPLNELTYLNLPIDQQGTILYFELTGSTVLGELILAAVDEFAYRALPDSAQGEIRYFRKLVGKGGEFAYDRQGEVLSLEAYDALPSAEKGSILAVGELLRIDFRAKVLLNGTTLDVAIRDSGADPAWQSVDPGDATTLRPGAELSIAVPFDRVVVRALSVEPPVITPNGDGLNDQGEIRFSIANVNLARQIDLRVYDLGGRIVWQESRMSFGDQAFFWDGRDNNGNLVAPGIYLCRVEVDADSGQASRLADQRSIAVAY
jgi:hypothetical protein